MNCLKTTKILYKHQKNGKILLSQPFAVAEVFTSKFFFDISHAAQRLFSCFFRHAWKIRFIERYCQIFQSYPFYIVGGPEEILKKQKSFAEEAEKMRARQLEQEKRASESNVFFFFSFDVKTILSFLFEESPKQKYLHKQTILK